MTGDELTDWLLANGVEFPEGTPTKWHHRCRGQIPRTILSYEESCGYQRYCMVDAECTYNGILYSDVHTYVPLKSLDPDYIVINADPEIGGLVVWAGDCTRRRGAAGDTI